jgi:hypothetical protein
MKIYILPCTHISFEINMSLIKSTCPQGANNAPRGGAPQFENLWTMHYSHTVGIEGFQE